MAVVGTKFEKQFFLQNPKTVNANLSLGYEHHLQYHIFQRHSLNLLKCTVSVS